MRPAILTLNGGSATLKVGLFCASDRSVRLGEAMLERFAEGPIMRLRAPGLDDAVTQWAKGEGPRDAGAGFAFAWPAIKARHRDLDIVAVGHRIVHGGRDHAGPCVLNQTVLAALDQLSSLAPLHQPVNLAVVAAAQLALPKAVHVACFDTAFHRGRRFETEAFALPRSYYDEGVRRYGFHGLSYASVVKRMRRDHADLADKKVVVAHLGSGCSLCALENGHSVATTMGFSALEGLPMGTRCGQIDPGVLLYLMTDRGMSAQQVEDLLYRRSGLLGLSGVSADVRDLEASGHPAARQALDYFCSRVAVAIGTMAAELGGLDAVVFTAGIGEHAGDIRRAIITRLAWLGTSVSMLVVPTDEESEIAAETADVLAQR